MSDETKGKKEIVHPSHKTRFSFDASTYDEICDVCGATDNPLGMRGVGPLGDLVKPCSKAHEGGA